MDQVTAQGRPLPPPFLTRDLHLHPHHQFQPHLNNHQTNIEEEQQSGNSALNRGQKRDRDDNNNNIAEGKEDGVSGGGGSGSGGEMGRRPRGRPAGSKNKPKPPIIITRDSANALRSHVMEIANGCDIMESVTVFARRRQRRVCVLSGSGTVTNVTLRQPASPGAVVTLHGRFEILSLSGSFCHHLPLPPRQDWPYTSPGTRAGGWWQRGWTLVGLSPVVIMAASFGNAAYERLPLEEEETPVNVPGNGGLGSPGIAGTQQQQQGQQQQQLVADPNTSLFHGVPQNLLNSCQLPADQGYWGGSARPPF